MRLLKLSPNIVSDVDGTLTDGKYYMDENGTMRKSFHANDVVAVKAFKELGWRVIIITSATKRDSVDINRTWAEKKLKVEFIQAPPNKKLECLIEAGLDLKETYYVGDCMDDVLVFKEVRLSFCPNDAIEFVQKNADMVLKRSAGGGVLFEILEKLIDLEKFLEKKG